MNIDAIMRLAPVIPVLVLDGSADPVALAQTLVGAGLPVIEVTMRTPAALHAVRVMKRVEGAVVGAGTVLTANGNFLEVMGYTLAEVQGKHHRIFCDPLYTATDEYRKFWEKLGSGDFHTGEYRRLAKDGSEVLNVVLR